MQALKRPLTVFAALVVVTLGFGLLVGPALNDMLFGLQSTSTRPKTNVTILMWYGFFGDTPYALDHCPLEHQCVVVYDRSLIDEADAVVFHIPVCSQRGKNELVKALRKSSLRLKIIVS